MVEPKKFHLGDWIVPPVIIPAALVLIIAVFMALPWLR